LEVARHGTAYTVLPAGKLQELKQFAILIDLTTASDGLDSLEKIFGYLISQEAENFFLAQWKDGIELRIRTERNAAGMIFGADGVLEREKETACLIIYDGQMMHLYANGKLIRKDNRGPLSFNNWSRGYPLVVGTDATGRSQWRGNLYEVAIYDRALSPKEIDAVSSDQWPVTSEKEGTRDTEVGTRAGQEQDKRPLIHYVFKPEYTYETEFRGKKALGVRDLGKGEPADLVIPQYYAPYQRVYLGWDQDWTKRSGDWLDLSVNILGFIPFGALLVFALGAKKCLSVLVPECLSDEKEGTRDQGVGTSNAKRQGPERRKRQATSRKDVVAVILAVVVGFGVSFAIEYIQAYLPSRDSSLRDLFANTLGTALGAAAAAWYSRKGFGIQASGFGK